MHGEERWDDDRREEAHENEKTEEKEKDKARDATVRSTALR